MWTVLKMLGALLLAGLLIAPVVSADVRFVLRAAWEETRLLMARRPLAALVEDPRVPERRRATFRMVLALREYASTTIGLRPGEAYTSFADVGRDTLVLVLSASPRARLEPYVWRFPIVGAVPYHGYFSLRTAQAAAADLERRGYDTYLRPASAFSTLGWFSDPLLSTVVDGDSLGVAVTVVHEMAHTTLYVPNQTPFNESFASFVGYRGAAAFFRSIGDIPRAQRAAALWRDEIRLSGFYAWITAALESAYADTATIDEGRARVFAEARARLASGLDGTLEAYRGEQLATRTLNNASIIAARIYRERLDLFERAYQRHGADLRATIDRIADAVRGAEDPYGALEAALTR